MSRFVRSNVLEHFDGRMFETFWGQNVMSSPFSPRRGRRTDRCARAPRQLPRRADDYRVQPSTPPPNTSQPPYRPAGHRRPKGSPERLRGPKGFGRRGPLVHDRFVVTAAAPLRQSCVSSVSRPCGRWVSRPCGRWVSRRCAVWTLAAWRGLNLHARLGLRRSVGKWSAIPPVPAPHLFPASSSAPCALTPRG